MPKQIALNSRNIEADGSIALRFEKQIADGTDTFHVGWHRALFAPGADIDAGVAVLNTHLTEMGFGTIPSADVTAIKAVATLVWTSDVIAAYAAAHPAPAAEEDDEEEEEGG